MGNTTLGQSQRSQDTVLNFIASRGELGVTDAEVGEALGIKESTVRDRRKMLHLQGRIRPTGTRPSNKPGSRIKSTIWEYVP